MLSVRLFRESQPFLSVGRLPQAMEASARPMVRGELSTPVAQAAASEPRAAAPEIPSSHHVATGTENAAVSGLCRSPPCRSAGCMPMASREATICDVSSRVWQTVSSRSSRLNSSFRMPGAFPSLFRISRSSTGQSICSIRYRATRNVTGRTISSGVAGFSAPSWQPACPPLQEHASRAAPLHSSNLPGTFMKTSLFTMSRPCQINLPRVQFQYRTLELLQGQCFSGETAIC